MHVKLRRVAAGKSPECTEVRLEMRDASPEPTEHLQRVARSLEVWVTPISMHCAAERWMRLVFGQYDRLQPCDVCTSGFGHMVRCRYAVANGNAVSGSRAPGFEIMW